MLIVEMSRLAQRLPGFKLSEENPDGSSESSSVGCPNEKFSSRRGTKGLLLIYSDEDVHAPSAYGSKVSWPPPKAHYAEGMFT